MRDPKGMLESFEGALKQNTAQDPQQVADEVLALIEKPKGEKPFRTVVDNMGMGEPLKNYNEMLHNITKGIYQNFGIEGMLEV